MYLQKHTEETKKKLSDATKKLWQNPVYRKNVVKNHSGLKHSGVNHWNYGKHYSAGAFLQKTFEE